MNAKKGCKNFALVRVRNEEGGENQPTRSYMAAKLQIKLG